MVCHTHTNNTAIRVQVDDTFSIAAERAPVVICERNFGDRGVFKDDVSNDAECTKQEPAACTSVIAFNTLPVVKSHRIT